MSGEPEEQKDSVKITLIGSAGVGKTCIIRRYTQNTYDNNPTSTTGGSYSVKNITINNRNIQMDIWDTAGQERFRALGKHFYKDSYIVCLVYDITIAKSFDEVKEIWYPDLLKNGEKYQIIGLVGNKCDLYENEEVNEESAREFAKEIKAEFYQVSAKSGDNISALFEGLVRKYLGPEFEKKISEIKLDRSKSLKLDEKEVQQKDQENKVKKKKFC